MVKFNDLNTHGSVPGMRHKLLSHVQRSRSRHRTPLNTWDTQREQRVLIPTTKHCNWRMPRTTPRFSDSSAPERRRRGPRF